MPAPREPVTCEIIAIGNELLIGDAQDTNTYWLIQQITGLGGVVRRCSIVRDETAAIADVLRASVAARSSLIITSGGLGPTGDDLTLAAVAEAFDAPLVVHDGALEMLTRRYAELAKMGWVQSSEMTAARRKMATFPTGAEPIRNPAGGAPAALLRVGESTIVCLPGVPRELKSIFSEALNAVLGELFGDAAYRIRSVLIECRDESFIAAGLQVVVERNPRVYLKSRSVRAEQQIRLRVSLSASGASVAAVDEVLDGALADLRETLAGLGLGCVEETAV